MDYLGVLVDLEKADNEARKALTYYREAMSIKNNVEREAVVALAKNEEYRCLKVDRLALNRIIRREVR